MNTYHQQQKQEKAVRLRQLIKELPSYCFEFFRGIEPTTSIQTRIAYAYDLHIFYDFLTQNIRRFENKDIIDFTLEDLDKVTVEDLERYLDYLSYYKKAHPLQEGKVIEYQNNEKGKARKLATLRTMYSYFYKKQKIKTTPTRLVDLPKIHEKNITRLEVDEVARLLDLVETGDDLTKSQKKFHQHTRIRDLALITLLLGTGIRVSECVGLNIKDIDFDVNGLKITRKGGNEVIIYFGDEVEKALLDYLEVRVENLKVQSGHEDALFLSLQNRRISVRSVQNIVKKYASHVTQLKNISPHKLRSTYGTTLYQETGDIYLVADVLGHKDVNTTRKHYAQIEDARRRQAARVVRLRD